jgi:hypothetical protein
MNSPNENRFDPHAPGAGDAEETLRLIAGLPAPEGLEDRVKAALHAAPRTGRVLQWPTEAGPGRRWMQSPWARSAAAAAIVAVVAGGGWGVYSRVQPAQPPRVIAMPRVAAPGGFSSAGAMRTPQTLNRPVLNHPLKTIDKRAEGNGKQPAHAAKKALKAGNSSGPGKTAQ